MPQLTADEKIAEELTRHGLRATRQRIAALRKLRRMKSHPTSAELHARLVPAHKNISQKTVYEILDALVEASLACRISVLGDAQRYEAKQEPHFHATCRVCDQLYDVPIRAESTIQEHSELPRGFSVEDVKVTIVGVCRTCTSNG